MPGFISRGKKICHEDLTHILQRAFENLADNLRRLPKIASWAPFQTLASAISAFLAVNQQCPFRFERAKLRGVAEPTARINLRRRRRIGDAFALHCSKTSEAEKFAPLFPGEQMRFYREQLSPLMAMRIV